MKRTNRSTEALALLVITALGMAFNLSGASLPALRVIFGFLFAFVLPGYALFLLMLRGERTISDRVLISLGISLVFDILVAFILHLTPAGLNMTSWTLALGGMTAVASLAVIIFTQFDKDERLAAGEGINVPTDIYRLNRRDAVLFALAVLLVVGGLFLARDSAARVNSSTFTQFWLIPPEHSGQNEVQLGLANQEGKTVTYRLELKLNGQVLDIDDRWGAITVEPGGTWQQTLTLPPAQLAYERIEADLYLADKPDTVYRWAKFERSGAK